MSRAGRNSRSGHTDVHGVSGEFVPVKRALSVLIFLLALSAPAWAQDQGKDSLAESWAKAWEATAEALGKTLDEAGQGLTEAMDALTEAAESALDILLRDRDKRDKPAPRDIEAAPEAELRT